jgi:hypothetical protein
MVPAAMAWLIAFARVSPFAMLPILRLIISAGSETLVPESFSKPAAYRTA